MTKETTEAKFIRLMKLSVIMKCRHILFSNLISVLREIKPGTESTIKEPSPESIQETIAIIRNLNMPELIEWEARMIKMLSGNPSFLLAYVQDEIYLLDPTMRPTNN